MHLPRYEATSTTSNPSTSASATANTTLTETNEHGLAGANHRLQGHDTAIIAGSVTVVVVILLAFAWRWYQLQRDVKSGKIEAWWKCLPRSAKIYPNGEKVDAGRGYDVFGGLAPPPHLSQLRVITTPKHDPSPDMATATTPPVRTINAGPASTTASSSRTASSTTRVARVSFALPPTENDSPCTPSRPEPQAPRPLGPHADPVVFANPFLDPIAGHLRGDAETLAARGGSSLDPPRAVYGADRKERAGSW